MLDSPSPRPGVLARLVQTAIKKPFDTHPSIDIFTNLDVDHIASELELERLGRERGANNEPLTSSATLDDVEHRIVERVGAAHKSAHALVEDQIRTYAERLTSLDFEGRFDAIRQALPACLGEFKAEVAKGLTDLHGPRRHVREAQKEYDAFRKRHRLERTAHLVADQWLAAKWAVLAVLLIVETALNGSYLAKGSQQGLLGGISLAIGFAFANIGFAFLFARGAAYIWHRAATAKLLGVISISLFLLVSIAINLALAHYREISETVIEGASRAVMMRLRTSPLGFEDIDSLVLFAVGFLFSVIAFFDSLSLTDRYPGFASVEKKLTESRQAYADLYASLIDDLGDIRDRYRDEMSELSRDLSVRRSTHDNIIASQQRLIELFRQHQLHIQRSANAIFNRYRDANRKARQTEAPLRFSQSWELEEIRVVPVTSSHWHDGELKKHIRETQDLLTNEAKQIHGEFERAMDAYRKLDEVNPDEDKPNGP